MSYKNFNLLKIYNISYIEKYLKDIFNLSFEYISIFPISYNLNSFKTDYLYNININYKNLTNIIYLLNLYLEKDYFYSYLYTLVNLKAKLKFNQLFQILNIKGESSFTEYNKTLLSNLYNGLNLKDFIYSSFTSRNSIIDSGLNISESGYLTRKLVESLRNIYIKCSFCYTKYLYKNIIKNIYINLPFLCLNNKSICLKCLIINYKDIISLGYNKGTIGGQALGEPSTQMLLRTFHLGDKLIFKSLLGINKYKFNNNKFKYIIKYLNYYIFYNYILKYLNIIRFNIIYFNKYNIYNIFNLSIIKFNYLLINKILNNLWIITYLYNYLYKLNNNIYINNINKKNYLLF